MVAPSPGMLPHRVVIVRKRDTSTRDAYGAVVRGGPEQSEPYLARVDAATNTEDTDDREQATDRLDIVLVGTSDIASYDELIWLAAGEGVPAGPVEDTPLAIIGNPELLDTARGREHVEMVARRVVG